MSTPTLYQIAARSPDAKTYYLTVNNTWGGPFCLSRFWRGTADEARAKIAEHAPKLPTRTLVAEAVVDSSWAGG
jgi:hypothetical protein